MWGMIFFFFLKKEYEKPEDDVRKHSNQLNSKVFSTYMTNYEINESKKNILKYIYQITLSC
jgi:hypothetical protein